MNHYWTSIETISGLRHFVIINKFKEKGEYILELVALIDDEISLRISKKELENSNKWKKGFVDYKERNIDINTYKAHKERNIKINIRRFSIKENSTFYIF